jgi:hypothetical protein
MPAMLSRASLLAVLAILPTFGSVVYAQPSPAVSTASIESDVETIARLQARRYEIWASRIDSQLTGEDREQLSRDAEEIRAIEQKYSRPGSASAGQAIDLRNRARQRLTATAGPAWNRLLLERFPSVERVAADFPPGPRRAAAYSVLHYTFALGSTLRPPRTPELTARDEAYDRAGVAALGTSAKDQAEFSRLIQDAAFKREVLGRYVPLLASFVRDEPGQSHTTEKYPWLHKPVFILGNGEDAILVIHVVGVVASLAGIVGFFVIPVRRMRRAGRRHNRAGEEFSRSVSDPYQLPEAMRLASLPGGARIALSVTSGVVIDKEAWVEQTVVTTTRPATQNEAPSTSTQVHSVRKDRLWLLTTAGKEETWTITGDVFPARPGQAVSFVSAVLRREQTLALAYNHATGTVFEKKWVAEAHRRFWSTFFLTALWCGVCVVVTHWAFRSGGLPMPVIGAEAGALVFLLIYLGIVRAWIVGGRSRAWRKYHRPQVLAWLEKQGPVILASAGGVRPGGGAVQPAD